MGRNTKLDFVGIASSPGNLSSLPMGNKQSNIPANSSSSVNPGRARCVDADCRPKFNPRVIG